MLALLASLVFTPETQYVIVRPLWAQTAPAPPTDSMPRAKAEAWIADQPVDDQYSIVPSC